MVFNNVIKNNNELTEEQLSDLIFNILETTEVKRTKPSHKIIVTALNDNDAVASNYMKPIKKEEHDKEEF